MKFRWSRVYESTEEELLDFLAARSIDAQRVHLAEFTQTEGTVAGQDTVFYCVDGSMNITIDKDKIAIQAGDAVTARQGQSYFIDAGLTGCTYYAA